MAKEMIEEHNEGLRARSLPEQAAQAHETTETEIAHLWEDLD